MIPLSSYLCFHIFLLSHVVSETFAADGNGNNAMTGFIGVEGGQYYGRAFSVFLRRTTKWTKKLPEGSQCSMHGPRCSLGLLCVGPTADSKLCTRPSALDEYCDKSYLPCEAHLQCVRKKCIWPNKEGSLCKETKPCADGLTCHHGVCYKRAEGDVMCDGQTHKCNNGLVCTQGFCREPRIAGQECSLWDPCHTDLLCLDNKCSKFGILPLGVQCKRSEQCTGSLACIDGVCSRNRCGKQGDCEKFEICRNYKCMSKKKDMETCTTNSDCLSGLCFGYNLGRCIPKRNRGETCAVNYLSCSENLICVYGKCQDVRLFREACVHDLQCKGSLLCGIDGCYEPGQIGDQCDENARCDSNSRCHEGKCRPEQDKLGAPCSTAVLCKKSSGMKCVEGECRKAIAAGQSCSRHVDCEDHLYCSQGKCKAYESIGDQCDSERLCKTTLMCQDNVCAMIQMESQPCNKYMACGVGLYCDEEMRICKKLRNVGGRCSKRSRCAPGLKCVSGKCTLIRKIGESCHRTEQCPKRAFCKKNRCSRALLLGNSCSRSLDYCLQGLVCNKYNRCVPGKTGGQTCDDRKEFCAKGSFCAFRKVPSSSSTDRYSVSRGRSGVEGRCIRDFEIGQPCLKGFINCNPLLKCVNGICRSRKYLGTAPGEGSSPTTPGFRPSAPASETCSFRDPCKRKLSMSAANGEFLHDSCGRLYYVDNHCTLYRSSRVCQYTDACNRKKIFAPKGGILRDSCDAAFYVDMYCTLQRK